MKSASSKIRSYLNGRVWNSTMSIMALCGLLLSGGCISTNYKITGQVEAVRTDLNGDLTTEEDRRPDHQGNIYITEGDVFSIRMSSVFLRNVKEAGGAEYLVYAEVYDVQPDDRQRLVKVLFKENNQSAGYLVNQRDRLAFGPIKYNGHPIRIRVFVVELDKEENAIASEMIKQAVRTAATFQPQLAPFAGPITGAGDLMLSLNQDDRELAYDFTLYPSTHSEGPYLKTGNIVLLKTENEKRFTTNSKGVTTASSVQQASAPSVSGRGTGARPAGSSSIHTPVTDDYGHRIDVVPEDYVRLFSYAEDEHPLRRKEIDKERATKKGKTATLKVTPLYEPGKEKQQAKDAEVVKITKPSVQPYAVLRVMNSQLWLQTVLLEYIVDTNSPALVLRSDPRIGLLPEVELDKIGFKVQSYKVGGLSRETLIAPDGQAFTLGQRVQYREKTHAVITISRGGKPHDRALFEELSVADQKVLDNALQPELTSKLVSEKLKNVVDGLVKVAVSRDVVKTVNSQITDDAQRTSPEFPLAYLAQLEENPDEDGVIKNQSIIEIVGSMVSGLPFSSADAADKSSIMSLKALTAENFSGTNGLFKYISPQRSTGYVVRSVDGVLYVKDPGAHEFAVYKQEPQGLVKRPASEFLFMLEGSAGPALAGTPSTLGGSSVDDAGKYKSGHKVVPAKDKADVIRIFERANPTKELGKLEVALSGFVSFNPSPTIRLADGTSATIEWGGKREFAPNTQVTLQASLSSTRPGGTLTAPEDLIVWRVISSENKASDPLANNQYTIPVAASSTEVTLQAASVFDPSVKSEPITLVIKKP